MARSGETTTALGGLTVGFRGGGISRAGISARATSPSGGAVADSILLVDGEAAGRGGDDAGVTVLGELLEVASGFDEPLALGGLTVPRVPVTSGFFPVASRDSAPSAGLATGGGSSLFSLPAIGTAPGWLSLLHSGIATHRRRCNHSNWRYGRFQLDPARSTGLRV